mmetsp:Transcript_10031/g.24765  ORF Transcript_10031/g.24765 Transcript_10031/m.24765 type:complete len:210 (-) Transcript_10031:755-1384(-)
MAPGRSAVALAESVPASDESNRFLVVHGHASEGGPDVSRRQHRVCAAAGPFRVHVDEALHDGAQRVFQLVGLRLQVLEGLRLAPVHVLLLRPAVEATAAKAELRQPHVLHRHVAREDEQVAPGQRLSVLLLDGPKEPPSLVEVAVVGPGVERVETLVAGVGAATTVRSAVGTSSVPGHANHEGTVVAVVRRPPVLGVAQDADDVLLHGC